MKVSSREIAVIVPVYNRRTIVLEALKSISEQTERPGKVIIVDDGSTDGTSASVRQWISQCQTLSVKLVNQSNQGASSARNHGLSHVEGYPWIAFLDSDDLWPSDFLKRCSEAIQVSDTIAVTADREFINLNKGSKQLRCSRGIAGDAMHWIFCRGDGGIGSASVLRRDAVQALGGYDEKIPTGHDTALFLRLSLQGRWIYAPGLPVQHRRGFGSLSSEQKHINEMHSDYRRQWAIVREKFMIEEGFSSYSCYRRSLADRWYAAGRQLTRQRRIAEARSCFWKSIQWHFFNKAWLRLGRNLTIDSWR